MFTALRLRVDRNATRAVELYTAELTDYRTVAADDTARAAMMDFAVILRRREAELAADEAPFTSADLAVLSAFGEERGVQGVSLAAQRRVLVLHSLLTLREIDEVAGPHEVDHVMRMLGWLPANGLAAQRAYTAGFLAGQKRFLPATSRIRELARMLLADSSVAADLAASLELRLARQYLVLVLRMPSDVPAGVRAAVVDELLKQVRTPMVWDDAAELVILLPDAGLERGLALAATAARLVGRPCAVGAASGVVPSLAAALASARQIAGVAPAETVPSRVHTMGDVFVELGAVQVPKVDQWLRDLGQRLAEGPDLVATLDAFYRHDMSRMNTAGALHIHPRTLDYRLHRVRELVGMDPSSTRGVRTLSAAVARLLAVRGG